MNAINSWMIVGMGGFGGQGGQQGQSSPVMMIGWLVIMVGLFYFMMIRPQQRKEKERRALIAGVKSGDRVVFGGGLIGTVANIKDTVLVVKVAENTKLEVLRASVTRVILKDEDLARMEEEVAAEITRAVEFAEAGTWEPVEELTRFVYSEEPKR